MAPPDALNLPFDEAIRFFRQKINLPTRAWTDLWEGMHARAFVVAGATKDELIADLRASVDRALAEGTGIEEFRRDFDSIVQRHGWSYKGKRGPRTRTIFNTNLRMAYAAGKWNQIQRLARRRPFLRYVAVRDDVTRPEHLDWHGTVLKVEDAWWSTHYPPNGWGCRCSVVQLSQRDLKRFKFKRSKRAPAVVKERRIVKTAAGSAQIEVPKGIDTGFSYNVGDSAWGRGQQAVAMERHGRFDPLTAPGAQLRQLGEVPVDKPKAPVGPRARTEEAYRQALRDAIGGDEAIFVDPAGHRVAVGQAIVDHILASPARRDGRETFFPLIKELIEDPAEIWVGFARSQISERALVRRRYIKFIELDKRRVIGLVADLDGGTWSGMTFFRGKKSALKQHRTGHRVYVRE